MTRQSRMLLVMGFIAVAGVAALGVLAHRYGAVLQRHTARQQPVRVATPTVVPTAQSIEREVESFIQVRIVLRRSIDAGGATREAVRRVRRAALDRSRIDDDAYVRIRTAYRRWRSGEPVEEPYGSILERHRAELEGADLGPQEVLDR